MNALHSFKTVALIAKYNSAEAAGTVLELARMLIERGLAVLLDCATARAVSLPGVSVVDAPEIGQRADLAIVVGGDGTLLRVARELAACDVPLVGINQGRLGFMTDIPRANMAQAIAEILNGKYTAESRLLLEARVMREGACVMQSAALNEVVVSKSDGGRMIEFALHIDGEFIYNQRSDGLIVSTPTGSTAYALSANGPILHPAVAGIAIVPLCPHALTARPITVPQHAQLGITLAPGQCGRVHCDGQVGFDLAAGDSVSVTRCEHSIELLHPLDYSYFAMLREKLHWSEPAHINP